MFPLKKALVNHPKNKTNIINNKILRKGGIFAKKRQISILFLSKKLKEEDCLRYY